MNKLISASISLWIFQILCFSLFEEAYSIGLVALVFSLGFSFLPKVKTFRVSMRKELQALSQELLKYGTGYCSFLPFLVIVQIAIVEAFIPLVSVFYTSTYSLNYLPIVLVLLLIFRKPVSPQERAVNKILQILSVLAILYFRYC